MKILHGDYVPDGDGTFKKVSGGEELLQRALFKLTARRGGFAPMPGLGSRLYLLGAEKPSNRLQAAYAYAAEALEDEAELALREIALEERDGGVYEMKAALSLGEVEYTLEFTV